MQRPVTSPGHKALSTAFLAVSLVAAWQARAQTPAAVTDDSTTAGSAVAVTTTAESEPLAAAAPAPVPAPTPAPAAPAPAPVSTEVPPVAAAATVSTDEAPAAPAAPPVNPDYVPPAPPAPAPPAIELRRPSGEPPLEEALPVIDPSQVPPPTPLLPRESVPLPDRWRIVDTLGMKDDPFNPYAQNMLKADKPLPAGLGLGSDWFVNLGIISDTVLEFRRIPTPVSGSGTISPGANDVLGRGVQSTFNQTVLFSASLIEGDTTFKPPDYEFRLVPAVNYNFNHVQESGVLNANPDQGLTRNDSFAGLQEAYGEFHLRNVSDRYDFDSVRIGIQPFTSDFRGFVFQDDALGIRFFGNRDNNQWQYNLAYLRRIEKDTNSGLNDIGAPLRKDDTFIANLYHQDFPIQGNTTQITVIHNSNHEEEQYINANGFQVRPAEVGDAEPHHYNVTYVGLNTDGHFGRFNLTSSIYGVFGHDSHNPIAQSSQRIEAGFAAFELSRDFDWIRVRASGVFATGDSNPHDGRATGFDAINENPDIAGADTSFWIRQAIPLIGGGGVALTGPNGLLPDLRSSKDEGQSNFVNPGLVLLGIGADADITPTLRILGNVSHLSFANTSVLEELRAQGNISHDIGVDISTALQYRPFLSQNIVLSASIAALLPGDGFKELYNTEHLGLPYSVLFNLILRY
jgi:hypothetical protein